MNDSTCRWPECELEAYARQFCKKHYAAAYRRGNFESPWVVKVNPPKPCRWVGCSDHAKARGLCKTHYSRAQRMGDFDQPWLTWAPYNFLAGQDCRWPECERPAECRMFCDTHYTRAKSVGDYDEPWHEWERRYEPKPCKWPECDRTAHAKLLCTKHYLRAASLDDFDSPWEAWGPRPCAWCGESFQGKQSITQHCSPACSVRAYDAKNPDAVKRRVRQWDARNRDKRRMMNHRRRAWKRNTTAGEFTTRDVRLLHGDNCYLCGERINFKLKYPHKMSPSLDHVTALARGGTHTVENAAMTHLVCNVRKGARPSANLPTGTLFAI